MIPAFLILLQPDAGSTLVFLGLVIMIFREGFQNRYVFGIVKKPRKVKSRTLLNAEKIISYNVIHNLTL